MRLLPDEDIAQLNVRTTNYGAGEGFAAGSIDNTLSRQGTNAWHGSLFGFHSDNFLEASDPLNVPGASRWQAGGTAGGAVVPDHTFVFLSYQATLDGSATTQFATVPTASMLAGNFSGLGTTIYNPFSGTLAGTGRVPFTGNTISPFQVNPVSSAILGALPGPNLPGIANNLEAMVPFSDNSQLLDGRVDQRFNDTWAGFLRYGFSYIKPTKPPSSVRL
jgi:hypothetical protein